MYNLAFSADGQYLAAGGDSGKARIWDVQSGKMLLALNCDMDGGLGMALSKDGKTVAMAGSSVIRFWDVATGKEKSATQGHDAPILAVAFTPDGKGVATGGDNRQIHLWDAATGQHLRLFKSINASGLAFSPYGKRLAAIGREPHLETGPPGYIWNAETGEELVRLPNMATEQLLSLAFFPAGGACSPAFTTTPENRPTLSATCTYGTPAPANALSSSSWASFRTALPSAPDGQTVAIGGGSVVDDKCFLGLMDIKAGGKLKQLLGHEAPVESVALSPDGKLLVSGSIDKTVRLWEVATGKPLHKLEGHLHPVKAVAFSPDGRIVASGESFAVDKYHQRIVNSGTPQRIRLWDVATGKEVHCFEGHAAHVNSLAFSPDGSRLIAGLANGTALIWDTRAIAVGPGVNAK